MRPGRCPRCCGVSSTPGTCWESALAQGLLGNQGPLWGFAEGGLGAPALPEGVRVLGLPGTELDSGYLLWNLKCHSC